MKLDKVFTEVRFEKSLLFDDARTLNSIVKELKTTFPVYENNETGKLLAFFNEEKKIHCFIHNDRIIVDCDQPNDFQQFREVSGRVFQNVMGKFDVEVTERIGVRAHYHTNEITTETDSGNAIIQTFLNATSNEFIQKHAREALLQPRAGFMIKVGNEYFMNINIGYHYFGSIQMNSIGKQQMTTKTTSPLTDLDIYTNVPKRPDQIAGILRLSCDKIAEFAHIVWK